MHNNKQSCILDIKYVRTTSFSCLSKDVLHIIAEYVIENSYKLLDWIDISNISWSWLS